MTVIPEQALQNHVAVIGKTGAGKSFAARGLVERLLDEQRRVCIIDYTGVWYGLRSTASGKRAAYPVVIFGGEHGDVPLNEHAGAAVAKLIAGGSRPAIVDLDGLTIGAQHRFATAFLEELYRQNRQPLHLVFEEADEFCPLDAGISVAAVIVHPFGECGCADCGLTGGARWLEAGGLVG